MKAEAKVDVKRRNSYRARRGEFRLLEVPPLQYLMLDGAGDPNTEPRFTRAIETLFPVAYALKFASKHQGRDYVVPPLEGLWWASDMEAFTSARDKTAWQWTLMILTPEWLDEDAVHAAIDTVRSKRELDLLEQVRLETLQEGRCVQTLHVGTFDDEGGVITEMHGWARDAGMALAGAHHEIYLSDFRRADPAKWRTILRQPVEAGSHFDGPGLTCRPARS